MIVTKDFGFKKRELTDSPPDITATEDNWDLNEKILKNHSDSITGQKKQIDDLSGKVQNLDTSWKGIKDKPVTFPPTQHRHDRSEINNFPTSLPANGGNADTVGGRAFSWSGQQGTPEWLWGGNGGGNPSYVYSPSQLSVGYALFGADAGNLSDKRLRNTFISANGPSGGYSGDVWIQYL